MRRPTDTLHRAVYLIFAASVVLAAAGCRAVIPGLPGLGGGGELRGPEASPNASGPGVLDRTVHGRFGDREPRVDRNRERHRGALTVAVVSDMNGRYGSTEYHEPVHRAVDWITGRLRPDLVLSTGDHVAGQREGLDYGAMWHAFHRAFTRRIARAGIPFAPTPGNHDASAHQAFERERDRYVREWRGRRPDVEFVGGGRYPLYYAFEMGPALFVSLDATVAGPLPDRQMTWLKRVLKRHRDKPAKIVYSHLPLAPFAENRESQIIGDRKLEAVFDRYDVDAMLSGHHHAYYPGRRGDLKLVGLACLGGGARELIGTDRTSRHSALVMRVSTAGEVRVRARWGSEMQRTVDRESLPRAIRHGGWTVRRIGTPRRVARNP